jgi:hypothetical protein
MIEALSGNSRHARPKGRHARRNGRLARRGSQHTRQSDCTAQSPERSTPAREVNSRSGTANSATEQSTYTAAKVGSHAQAADSPPQCSIRTPKQLARPLQWSKRSAEAVDMPAATADSHAHGSRLARRDGRGAQRSQSTRPPLPSTRTLTAVDSPTTKGRRARQEQSTRPGPRVDTPAGMVDSPAAGVGTRSAGVDSSAGGVDSSMNVAADPLRVLATRPPITALPKPPPAHKAKCPLGLRNRRSAGTFCELCVMRLWPGAMTRGTTDPKAQT